MRLIKENANYMTTEEVWNDFKHELLGFIKSRINDIDLAEDILQEVFVKIHLNLTALNDRGSLQSWIYRIARNTIIDFYRKKKNIVYQDKVEELFPEELEEATKDFSNCLKSFIVQLSEKDREALELTLLGNLSQKEYAAKINLSYTAAKSRVQRAKEKLKKDFIGCCNLQLDKYGNIISSSNENCNC